MPETRSSCKDSYSEWNSSLNGGDPIGFDAWAVAWNAALAAADTVLWDMRDQLEDRGDQTKARCVEEAGGRLSRLFCPLEDGV